MAGPKHTDRPNIPEYGIEQSEEGLLDWEWADNVLKNEWNYWVSTVAPNESPHATPVWGIWSDNQFYFGGGSKTKKARNLQNNPRIVVHSETRDNVVIIEGTAEIETSDEVTKKIQSLYKEKYNLDHPPPFWKVKPKKVLGWKAHTPQEYQSSPTRWIF